MLQMRNREGLFEGFTMARYQSLGRSGQKFIFFLAKFSQHLLKTGMLADGI
jgi:hypothetical protein